MSVAAMQQFREAVERPYEDTTAEDSTQRLYFLAKAARRLETADPGDVVEHEEAEQAILGDNNASSEG